MNDFATYEKIPAEKNNFPVKLNRYRLADGGNFKMHWHHHTELLFFLSGVGTVRCGAEEYPVRKNTLVIVNGGELHSIVPVSPLEYYVIIISPPFFSDIDPALPIFEHLIEGDSYVAACVENIFSEYEAKTDGYDMAIKGAVYSLVAYLWRTYRAQKLSAKKYKARLNRLRIVNDAVKYINENTAEELSLEFFARKYFLSEYYFCHIFKEETGKSLTAYINGVRMQKAAALLTQTELTVTQTAAAVGFFDANYFCRVFKKHTGQSPSAYRKQA